MIIKKLIRYFTVTELIIWLTSICVVSAAFIIFDGKNFLFLAATYVGVTSLIFNAKGNPLGQALMIIFSVLYSIISYGFGYYGEIITYRGMTAPMSAFALVTWLKNPYGNNRAQVTVNQLKPLEIPFAVILTGAVTFAFYFVLAALNTSNLFMSTVSVATSFIAVYLTFRRSAFYAFAYAANDAVLITLWTWASIENHAYYCVTICFSIFFLNDLYGFICWLKMKKRQRVDKESA